MSTTAVNSAAPVPKENMGQPAPRVDGRLKVTGQANYASDFDVKNPGYAYLVTSAIAKGTITAIDDAEARAVDGVLLILTHENTADAVKQIKFSKGGGPASTSIVPLSSPKVWHDGQIVAVVVADRFEAAREAAHKLVIRYASEAPTATFGSPGTTDVAIQDAHQAEKIEPPKVGDFAKGFADAPVKVEADYATPTQHHNAIELFATTCSWDGPNLTIHEPSQTTYGLQHGAAEELKVDASQVRALSPYIGGAFGGKSLVTPRTALIAIAAKRLNRPVKLVASRADGYTINTYRAETRHRVKLAAGPDGKLQALSHEGWEITSRPDDYAVAGIDATTRMYACPNITSAVTIVHADRNTPGFMRAPAETPYMFALESAMDELAEKLAMDPIELRRVNDTTHEPIKGLPFTSRSMMKCFDQGSAAFGWSKRNPKPAQVRDGDWLVGLGCAMSCYPSQQAPAAARVRLEASGTAHVAIACAEIGNGAYTIVAQTAALGLGIDLAKVKVVMGDSSLPPGPVAGGSVTTASACNAVAMACEAVTKRLSTGRNEPGAHSLKEGRLVSTGGTSEELAQAFARIGAGAVEEYAEFVPHGSKPGAMAKLYKGSTPIVGGTKDKDRIMFAFGAQFVEVRVHARTKEVRVPRMVGAFASGHIVNTRTAHSQLMGGMIWGLSSGLLEATEIDPVRARYTNDNLAEYLVPVCADIGSVEVIMVPEVDTEVNPLGIKGLGELGIVGGSAALANAVYNATGTRIRELPVRIETLLNA